MYKERFDLTFRMKISRIKCKVSSSPDGEGAATMKVIILVIILSHNNKAATA